MDTSLMDKVLLDANIVLRLVVEDHPEHFLKAKEIFTRIEKGQLRAELLDMIIAEIVYVLYKVYRYPKNSIVLTLQKILTYKHIVVSNRGLLYKALEIFEEKNIDFADAMLCAKKQLEGVEVLSFDKKVMGC